MKKIKTWLIHLLGGVTVAESRKKGKKLFDLGMKGACIDIRDYADSLYGKPADEWSELMYEFICGLQERFCELDRRVVNSKVLKLDSTSIKCLVSKEMLAEDE